MGVKTAAGKSMGVGPFMAITVDLRCPYRKSIVAAIAYDREHRLATPVDLTLGSRATRRSDFPVSVSEHNFHRPSYLRDRD